ncbi:MAG TPA: cytochrome c, partial [Polyangiaceae bacterium]|nr:cytochrome c [Polyangiaceae bacterium]
MATRVDSRVAAVLGAVAVLVLGACTGTLGDYVGNNAGSASGGTPNDAGIPDASGGVPGVDSGNPPSGQEMFVAVCAPCHGSEGQGSPLGPELQHPVADFATWVVRSGRATTSYPAAMASFAPAAVSDAQLDEIWAWLDGLPKPTDGQELYEDYCANCHGSDALGGRVGKNIDGK